MLELLLGSTAIGLVCGAILNVFYVAVRHAWPQNYYGLEGSADPLISRNLTRYTCFRFIPPFLIFLAAAATAERLSASAWVAVAIAYGLHASRLVLAIQSDLRNGQRVVAAGHSLIMLLVALVALLAVLARGLLASLVPTPEDLVSNLWVGVIAAVGAVYLQRVVLVKQRPEDLLLTSISAVPNDLLAYARDRALLSRVPVEALFALMLAENLERPAWFRWLENHWPGNKSLRTLGIMQQRNSGSDQESIDKAVSLYFEPIFSRAAENISNGDLQTPLLEVLNIYNRSDDFGALALQFVELLQDTKGIAPGVLKARLALVARQD